MAESLHLPESDNRETIYTTLVPQITLIVPEVNLFSGHLACDSRSHSEIVVPLCHQDEVKLILDIDSDIPDHFSTLDIRYLEQIVQLVKRHFQEIVSKFSLA